MKNGLKLFIFIALLTLLTGTSSVQAQSNSHTQGNSHSNPDGAGVDKPYSANGQNAMTQGHGDYDGNNGCGNDDDFSDDNNGKCLGHQKSKHTPKPTPTPCPTPTPKPTHTPKPTYTPKPTATPTPTPTPTPTASPVATATPTPSPTATPTATPTPGPSTNSSTDNGGTGGGSIPQVIGTSTIAAPAVLPKTGPEDSLLFISLIPAGLGLLKFSKFVK